jgi:aerobic-type carbon monoxide dehydrogenase small subunit (CoxS/CutS family)
MVNGRERAIKIDDDGESLLTTLRERLHLTGTKGACERAECGACTVLLDDSPVYACLTLTAACDRNTVRTIDGLADGERLHPLQLAFVMHDAVQCGFCTPGQIMAALGLLETDPDPSDDAIQRALSGNLCRCGTYPRILRAVRAAAAELRASRT